jgi:N6-L-threonylcarbamoyladenine synthase
LRDQPDLLAHDRRIHDLCASVQAAIVEVLVSKTVRAALREGVSCVTASGGVTCNRQLRRDLAAACQAHGLSLRLAAPALCTDNAAMVGIVAERQLASGAAPTDLDAEIRPGWSLTDLPNAVR